MFQDTACRGNPAPSDHAPRRAPNRFRETIQLLLVCGLCAGLSRAARADVSPVPSISERGQIVLKETTYSSVTMGEFYQYIPRWVSGDSVPIVVLVHGTPGAPDGSPGDASDRAFQYLERAVEWADRHQVILLAPIFDDQNFASFGSGSNRYTRLWGRERDGLPGGVVDADDLLNWTLIGYVLSGYHDLPFFVQPEILLYGHSAGGQFASRYRVKHPSTIAACFLSSPFHLTFPLGDLYVLDYVDGNGHSIAKERAGGRRTDWPYGGDQGSGTLQWPGQPDRPWTYQLPSGAFDAAEATPNMIMVSEDDEPPGELHYERSVDWADQMDADWGEYPGGHSSANSEVQYALPFFEEQPAVADDRHRHWWVALL